MGVEKETFKEGPKKSDFCVNIGIGRLGGEPAE